MNCLIWFDFHVVGRKASDKERQRKEANGELRPNIGTEVGVGLHARVLLVKHFNYYLTNTGTRVVIDVVTVVHRSFTHVIFFHFKIPIPTWIHVQLLATIIGDI